MKRSFVSSKKASEHDFIQNKTSKKGDKQSRSELRSDPRERDEDSDGVEVDVSEKENSDDDADVVDHVNDSIDNGDRNGVEEEEEEEEEEEGKDLQMESHTPQSYSFHTTNQRPRKLSRADFNLCSIDNGDRNGVEEEEEEDEEGKDLQMESHTPQSYSFHTPKTNQRPRKLSRADFNL